MISEEREAFVSAVLGGHLNRREVVRRGAALGFTSAMLSALLAARGASAAPQPAVSARASAAARASTEESRLAGQATGGHLITAQGAFPPSLSPTESGNPSLSMLLQVMDGLTRTDAEMNVIPHLATEWETVDDTTWRFKLRDDVVFHNGERFNGHVAKFAIDRAIDVERGYARRGRIGPVTGVEVVDEFTILMKTEAPFPLLPRGLRDIVMEPPAYIAEMGDDHASLNPVGTGPFKVLEWVPGERLELEAYESYFLGRPKVDRLTVRNVAEPSTRLSALLSGEVHLAEQVPIDLVPQIESDSNLTSAVVPVAMGLVITFDLLAETPVSDIRVRQAIDHAIDRESLFAALLQGQGAILDGQLITEGSVGYNPNLTATPYDPDRAKALLAEAGYAEGLDLDFFTPVGKYLIDRDLAIAMAAQLEEVGIRTNVQVLEWGDYSERNDQKQLSPMHIIGWYNVGDAEFAMVWYSTNSSRSYWENQEFDELFNKAQSTIDPAEREKLFQQASEMMHDNLPSVFLFQLPAFYGLSKRVENWAPRPDEMLYLAETSLAD